MDGDAEVDDAMTENVDGPPVVDFGCRAAWRTPSGQIRVIAVLRLSRFPFLGLGGANEREQFGCVQAERRVEVGRSGI